MWWPHGRILLELFNVLDPEIAHADALRLSELMQLLEGLPHNLPLCGAWIGAVDEEQVHIATVWIKLSDAVNTLFQRLLHRVLGHKHLGRDVDVLARHCRAVYRPPNLRLVAVELRRVDVAVPVFEGGMAGSGAYRLGRLVHSEAKLRDLGRVGEGECVLKRAFGHGCDLKGRQG